METASRNRLLAISAAALFLVSWLFPLVAGLSRNTSAFPKWWGIADVSLAFVLVLLAFAVIGTAWGKINKQAEDSSYHLYRILNSGLLVFCVAYIFLGDRIIWNNCLTGFAWRAWLLGYALPAWLTLLRSS